MMEKRKHPRLKEYDYSQAGVYFITVCVKNRSPVLSSVVGRGALTPPQVMLSQWGSILDKYIRNIDTVYENTSVDKYVIMPNHFHMLLRLHPLDNKNGGLKAARPTVETIVRSLKTMVTREIGHSIWQTSFHEHIIRDEQDYLTRWNYIDSNPHKWAEDEYYTEK